MAGCGIGSLPSAAGLFWATPAKDICWYRVMSTSKTYMVVFMRLSEKYAVPEELALLYDFVNTLDRRRYVERGVVHAGGDELATPRRMEAWMRKHRLPASGKHVDAAAHRQALDLRSALRSFLELPPAERGHRRGAPADRGQQGFSADSDRCRRGNRHAGCGPWIECARSCRRGTIRPGEDGSACAVKGMRIRTVSLDFLRSLEAGQSALVLFQCMWQSSEDAGLSTSPDSWLHLRPTIPSRAMHPAAECG